MIQIPDHRHIPAQPLFPTGKISGNKKRIYPRFFPHLGQNFASSFRTCPHFGHTLVMGLFEGVICCGLSLTIRYRSSTSKLRKNTIIAQSAPFIPRDSASLYTNTRIRRPTTNQRSGMRNRAERPNNYTISMINCFAF